MGKNKKLLFTGGHYNSALVELDWLYNNAYKYDYEFDMYWVGEKYVDKKREIFSPEYKEVSKRKVTYINFISGKLFRTTSIKYIHKVLLNILKIPFGFYFAFRILVTNKPDLIISFGGYQAVPIVLIGSILGCKSVTHEQTLVIGLANRIINRFVTCVYTTWPVEYYEGRQNNQKMLQVGLPIRTSILGSVKANNKFDMPREKPTIYISGGKLGSEFINQLVISAFNELIEEVNIIWSVGVGKLREEYVQKTKNNPNVIVKEYFGESEISKVFSSANVFISRGGAHTIYEIALLNKKAVIIPIPWSSNNEQFENAKILEHLGLGVVLEQEGLTTTDLVKSINEILSKPEEVGSVVSNETYGIIDNADEILGKEIFKILQETP